LYARVDWARGFDLFGSCYYIPPLINPQWEVFHAGI
jgi:hypothetical protein